MQSSILKEKQDNFLDTLVGAQKKLYLHNKKDFIPFVIAFDFATAYPFQFTPAKEGPRRKQVLLRALMLAFAAKNISRYGYFIDTWSAQSDNRSDLPDDLGEYEGRSETIVWSMVGLKGVEYTYIQNHDSEKRALLGPATKVSSDKISDRRNVFDDLLQLRNKVAWSDAEKKRLPPADMFWAMTCEQFKCEQAFSL